MESGLTDKPERREHVDVSDLKRDLSSEFSPLLDPQPSIIEREHLQVYLRIRPFTSAESGSGESQDYVTIEPPDTVLVKPPSSSLLARLSMEKSLPQAGQRFQFSQVYGPETTQQQLFQGTVKDLVKNVLNGGNSLVFTYGVTNGGKTFTFLGPDADAGILPRSLDVIFSSIEEQVFAGTSIKPQRCREFTRLSGEQQAEEAAFKRNMFRQLKESDRSNISLLNCTNKTLLEGSSMLGPSSSSSSSEDKISLEVEPHTKFSVWVSFCEIYNENIHDLLEVTPSGAPRRTALRLSQDVKGNAFVKDLRWVQVNNAEEAYKVMKLGKKNQSFSSTRLNQLSSRSHSIFSIRVLRISDVGTPRVHTVSELCLCDLAGSERCAKTQNKGERLKEAGNINTSLLILGKCINALRHNQQAKLLQHVPFRESKLTHYLQGFFCGRGKACMIVNVNQCASTYDETLNVLKFSAVAQRVVVLSSRALPILPKRSADDLSVLIDNIDRRRAAAEAQGRRRSSLFDWDSSLEDVQEDEDDEEEESLMDDTMDQTGDSDARQQRQAVLLRRLQVQLKQERAESMMMEARVREETSREFSQLFSEMQTDFNDRLLRERELLEERAETRLEIFKNLISKMSTSGSSQEDSSLSELERKVLEMTTHKHNEEENEDQRKLLLQLQEKSEEVSRLQKQVSELQETTKMKEQQQEEQQEEQEEEQHRPPLVSEGSSPDRERLQEVLAALEKEKRGREEALAALEYQTMGKEEALTSLEEERRAREEAVASLAELRRSKEEVLVSLIEERRAKEEVTAALTQERRSREEALAALKEERSSREEAQRKEKEEAQQEADKLHREFREMKNKLETSQQQVVMETDRAEQALVKLKTTEAKLDQTRDEMQEKTSHIQTLRQEVQRLQQELRSPGGNDKLRGEVTELRNRLTLEEEKNQSQQIRILELEQETARVKDELQRQEEAAGRQAEELRRKLQEQEEREELRSTLTSPEEVNQLRQKLEEQTLTSQKRQEELEELEEKLRGQTSELQHKLNEQKETSEKLGDDLRQKIREQEQSADLLKAELQERKEKEEDLKKMNSDLQAELSSLQQTRASQEREAELQKELQEKEARVKSLQRSLREAQEQREEEESQAVQEARRKEVERRRELLAVAHEAIAQKDEELQKKTEEISRLQQEVEQEQEKLRSISVDLQRRNDEASDEREKLQDYKKQMQQVQKEISVMREEEKSLRLKLSDAEKSRKQLQSDVTVKDRTILQLRGEQSSESRCDQMQHQYQKACEDLEAKQSVMENMRLALTEQEETQEQMEQVLEEKLEIIQELSNEVEKLKGKLLQQNRGNNSESESDDVKVAKQEAAAAREELKASTEKHQADRRKWLEEKLCLIGQAKEAEDKRNQEMRKFADDRERYNRQQSQLESLSSQLSEKDEAMERWRTERDALVAALEVQLQKLLSSQVEKDQLIQQLQQGNTGPPPEGADVTDAGVTMATLQAALSDRDAEILRLKEQLKTLTEEVDTLTQTESSEAPVDEAGKPHRETINRKSEALRDKRASVSSQGSTGYPSVLDSSEISTENGRTSRFPRPELEISFSPLQPNRMALRRQGEESAVTVKITRTARKRKSGEMEKEEVEAENRRNMKTRLTPKLTTHQEEVSSLSSRQDSQSSLRSLRSRREGGGGERGGGGGGGGALQKIGDFLQSSPTLLGSKAKKMMSLVSGRADAESPSSSSSSSSLRAKKNKKKLYRPEISSPMEMPPHPIISREPEEKESDHQIMKRRLRSKTVK